MKKNCWLYYCGPLAMEHVGCMWALGFMSRKCKDLLLNGMDIIHVKPKIKFEHAINIFIYFKETTNLKQHNGGKS